MRQQRTIYFNDARHYYLFAFEPPMALEDAWVPIDEVAGTGGGYFCLRGRARRRAFLSIASGDDVRSGYSAL